MYTTGEYSIAAKFPSLQSTFCITFYGANKKGNAYIDLFREDGSIISSVTLSNVNNGPYYFISSTENIAGFSVYNNDIESGVSGIYIVFEWEFSVKSMPSYLLFMKMLFDIVQCDDDTKEMPSCLLSRMILLVTST